MNVTLLTVGDNVVDRYPALGMLYPGGNAVNVAVHGRRCGAGTAYIGAVGTDLAGAPSSTRWSPRAWTPPC